MASDLFFSFHLSFSYCEAYETLNLLKKKNIDGRRDS